MKILETIEKLKYLHSRYGNIDVVELVYEDGEYNDTLGVMDAFPTVVEHPMDKDIKVVILDF